MKRLLLILVGWLALCLPSQSQSVYKMQYWFDGQYSTCVTDSNASGLWQIQLDVGHLSEGLHSINFHFRDTSDHWSSPRTYLFYKSDTANLTYICWFDEDFASRLDGSVGTGNILLDVDSLSDGTHIVNMLLGEGANTLLKSWLFVKIPTTEQIEDSSYLMLVYMVDEEAMPAVPVDAHTGLAHLNIEVGLLPSGIHTLDYFVLSSDGSMSTPTRAFFYSGNNGIRKYEWWLNDGDTAKRVIDVPPQDTFQLVTMLLVDTLPLRPSCLHFVPTEPPPLIYAKNDIHFRFWDNRGVFVQIDSQYVDYNIVDTVYADTIERNSNRTIATPTGSEIHWFKLNVSVGDSMAFMTNRACGMQLYSPTGEEVYSASGVKSIYFGGCHAFMDGDYYLAVHTANTAGGDSLTVHYKHIDKYALLAFSPNEFGNWYGSRITIELLGNGYNSLDSVLLINNSDTLVADTLMERSRTSVVASCLIKDSVSNGVLDLVLRFSDTLGQYTIVSSNAITLEEQNFGKISVAINGPVGDLHPYPLKITVTNNGNIDYNVVPLNLAFTNPDVIQSIYFKNFSLEYSIVDENEDSPDIVIYTDSLFGTSQQGIKIPTFISHLGARQTLTYEIELEPEALSSFDVYAWSDNPIEYYFSQLEFPGNARATKDSYPCLTYRNILIDSCLRGWARDWAINHAIERFFGAAAGFAWTISNGAICGAERYAKGINAGIDNRLDNWNHGRYGVHTQENLEYLDFGYNRNYLKRNNLKTPGRFCGCFGQIMAEWHRRHDGDCENPGQPFVVRFDRRPFDPNDIIGFTAESGSRYIGKDVETVGYEIEFENDTARATASAHIVVVRDTLDASRFDFSSFEWSGISIGEHAQMIEGGKKVYRTIDLRPAINVLAEAVMDFDTLTGIATCTISSLEPMTLEPVIDFSRGVLPVNYFGQGEGSISFKINLANNLVDGTVINNRASIVFDNEDAIMTPTWTNIMDLEDPVSQISRIDTIGDSITLYFQGTDNRSGIWHYNIHGRQDITLEWVSVANNIEDTMFHIGFSDSWAYYKVTAIDSAGNMESLQILSPITLKYDTVYVQACDSFTWHQIVYTVDTVFIDTVGTLTGYDSVVILNLTINHSSNYIDIQTACDSYIWHGTEYTASTNEPTYTTTNVMGCDSTVTLYLAINYSTTSYDSVSTCDSYEWRGNTYTMSGTDTYSTTNAAGCDSTVTLNLTINHSTNGDTSATACDTFTWWDDIYTSSTDTPTHTYTNAVGCDSTVTLHITINHSTTGDTTATACDTFTWWDDIYTSSTDTPTHTYTNAVGCDSIVTLHLTINHSTTGDTSATACDTFTWWNNVYTNSTDTPTYTYTNAVGCDSTVTLYLTINSSTIGDTSATACDTFTWWDDIYTSSTDTPTHTYINAAGCDSTVTLHLTIGYSTTGDTSATACDTFTWWDEIYTSSTDTPTHTYTNAVGCDSIVTLHLTINHSTTSDTSATACGTFTWWDEIYTSSTDTPTHTYTNAAGCDSIVTLHLTIGHSTTGDTSATACDTFTWWDDIYTSSTDTPTHTYTNAAGCDSTVTLHLTINHSAEVTVTDTSEGSYSWHDSTYTESGTYQWHGTTSAGCDSTVTLILVINQVSIELIDETGLDVVVYPNPTTGWITIDADGVLLVEVLDQTGHKVATYEQTNRIKLGGLPVGGYLLKIHLQKGISVQRVLLK